MNEYFWNLPGQVTIRFQRIIISWCRRRDSRRYVVSSSTIAFIQIWHFTVVPSPKRHGDFNRVNVMSVPDHRLVRCLRVVSVTPSNLTWREISFDIELHMFPKIQLELLSNSTSVLWHFYWTYWHGSKFFFNSKWQRKYSFPKACQHDLFQNLLLCR